MSRIFTLGFILLSAISFNSFAQQTRSDEPDRQKWILEIRNYKHEFLAKELDLSKDQQKDFFEVYDQMEDRLNQLSEDTRRLEQTTLSNPDASDVEIEAATRAVYDMKEKEYKIENEFFEEFKKTLKPRQLLQLKSAERKFTQQLMNHHRRLKKNDVTNKKK